MLAFNLYRTTGAGQPVKLNPALLVKTTCYQDAGVDVSQPVAYFVRPILNGREQEPSVAFKFPADAPARPYLSIPLKTPPGYAPNDASAGDLDGILI